jgi:hypothetical protein
MEKDCQKTRKQLQSEAGDKIGNEDFNSHQGEVIGFGRL